MGATEAALKIILETMRPPCLQKPVAGPPSGGCRPLRSASSFWACPALEGPPGPFIYSRKALASPPNGPSGASPHGHHRPVGDRGWFRIEWRGGVGPEIFVAATSCS